nr:hypothetical protein [uncultured Undibacterium sp.]
MSSSRLRRTILIACFAGTLAAIWYPVDETPSAQLAPKKKLPVQEVSARQTYANTQFIPSGDDQPEDPFAPRAWIPAPAVSNQTVSADINTVQTVSAVEAAPRTPQLPYRFLGKLLDGEDLIVYLGRGDQTIIARVGEVLEGTYKVLSVSDKSMEFEHLPSNEKQILSIE